MSAFDELKAAAADTSRQKWIEVRSDAFLALNGGEITKAEHLEIHRAHTAALEEEKRLKRREERRNRCDFALGAVVAPRDRDISKDDYTPTELMNCRAGESAVYFLYLPLARAIKIGVALDINKRLPDIAVQSPIPVVFLGACAGDAEYERKIHRYFAPLRIHGEWFKDTPELRTIIAQMIAEYPHRTMRQAQLMAEGLARRKSA
jgi:hypothetical protein